MDFGSLPPLSPPDCSWQVVGVKAPPSGKLVLYRTAYYQMMGYVNRFGHWIGSDGKPEDLPVQWWRELDPEQHWSQNAAVEH